LPATGAILDEFDLYLLVGAGAWLVLQVMALWKLHGGWRMAAWLSAVAMGLALVVATLGVLAGSNLAPIWVVFALPVCLSWIVMLWIVRGVTWAMLR
jgi:hypothetical protein